MQTWVARNRSNSPCMPFSFNLRYTSSTRDTQTESNRMLTEESLMHGRIAPDEDKIRAINNATHIDQSIIEATSWHVRAALKLRRNFLGYYFMRPPFWRVLARAALTQKRMTPTFASLGAVRSGTSMLADYIMQHPCVVLPLAKEIGTVAIPTLRLLRAQLPTLRQKNVIERNYGRAITGYCTPVIPHLGFPYLASQSFDPKVKFVLILRDPVERTFAHWRWDQTLLSRVKRDPLWSRYPDFDEAMRLEIDSIQSCGGGGLSTLSGPKAGGYIQTSVYLPFIKNLFRFFPKYSVLIINSSDFFVDPIATAKKVYAFLELPQYDPVIMPVKNPGPPGIMQQSTREMLINFFRPSNQQLYEFIEQDMQWQ